MMTKTMTTIMTKMLMTTTNGVDFIFCMLAGGSWVVGVTIEGSRLYMGSAHIIHLSRYNSHNR